MYDPRDAVDSLRLMACVAVDAVRAWAGSALLTGVDRRGAPVFVMLPLDAYDPAKCCVDVVSVLPRLAAAGVRGVMVDVWWGVAEPRPGEYDFSQYLRLAKACKENRLLLQATMSWHACGGNVGDDVNIPLPEWVCAAGDEHGMWYTDRAGQVTKECLSLSADKLRVLPKRAAKESEEATASDSSGLIPSAASTHDSGVSSAPNASSKLESSSTSKEESVSLRTPLEAYADFVRAFLDAMGEDLVGGTVVELQVGCGPCGELRYPSYPLGGGRWAFPGVGEFQCFDKRMLSDLSEKAASAGHPEEFGVPPADTGEYNDKPGDARFYRGAHKTPRGVFFLEWYSDALVEHGRRMLSTVSRAIASKAGVTLAVKISGIHWWRLSSSRAAEAAAGYYVSRGRSAYDKISALMAEFSAVLDFTCLEMRTIDQPVFKARCGPRQLVREVFASASNARVRVAGENALERYDWRAYQQIIRAFRSVTDGHAYGFTFLRLGPSLLQDEHFTLFEKFVREMNTES